ncbi:unnamed protein product [Mytilus edulis]|uniref:Uncharacterized protein n=1 Tax=Mytilus edulis TaxID=6550 RepID=A0A8S3R6T2_MYTED|nr:unnamed protein product [Mytilus edulis]
MDTPTDICSDDYGHVYISGQGSNNIHRLTDEIEKMRKKYYCEQDWKVLDITLDAHHGIKEPVALCFNQDYRFEWFFNMNKMIQWILLFAFVIDMCVNANNFSYDQAYHTERKTWKAAFVECGSNGLEFDENVLINIDVRSDKEFWIGMAIYRVTTPWIEVLGCYAEPSGKEVFKTPSIVLCQKQCETYPLFGYSELTESCFCQHNENSSFTSECRDTHYSHFSFVYKVYTGHVSDNDDGECTTLFCSVGDNGLKSAHCNDTTDSGRINNGYIVGWGKPYLTSKQMCLERFQLLLPPETYCQSNIHTVESIRSWTNVFRAETKDKLTQAEPSTTTQSQSTVNARKIKKDASATLAIDNVRRPSQYKARDRKATSNQTCDIDKDSAPVYDEVNECGNPRNVYYK